MKAIRPVTVKNGAFNFCKFTLAGLLWLSVLLQNEIIVGVCFILLVLSVILKVKRAPLIVLYSVSVEKLFPSKEIVLDENAVLFAHLVGGIFSLVAIGFLVFINPLIGWIITIILAIMKTSGACGRCGAMKLYSCMNNPNGKCCRVGKRIKNTMQD